MASAPISTEVDAGTSVVPASRPRATSVSPLAAEHPLRNPHYRLWLTGSTISFLGDQFYFVALPWLVLQQTGSAVAMGTVLLAGSIPRAVLMLMGGAVSDRLSARKIMMATATTRTILVTAIGVLIWLGVLRMWELYALAIAFGVADAFAAPASMAYMPSLVKREQMVAATSVSQSAAQMATIGGPIPAGFVIKALGVPWAFFIDAISFLFIIGALWKLPDPPKAQAARKAVWRSIGEGIAYVVKDVPLRSLILLSMVLNFCVTGPIAIGLTYLAKTKFGSPAVFGTLLSILAAGSLSGTLLVGMLKVRRRGVMFLAAAGLLGASLTLIGFMGTVWSLGAVLATMGMLAGMMNVNIGAWIMARIDAGVRGRVGSVLMLTNFGLMPLSYAIAGFLVAWNVKLMFVLAGGLMLLAAAAGSLQKPVRGIE